jgi:epoxyqueuosine reductase
LLGLDDAAFREMFAGSPIKRIGLSRLLRNCLIAAGNSRDAALGPAIAAQLTNPDPVISEAARWALAQPEFSSAETQAA